MGEVLFFYLFFLLFMNMQYKNNLPGVEDSNPANAKHAQLLFGHKAANEIHETAFRKNECVGMQKSSNGIYTYLRRAEHHSIHDPKKIPFETASQKKNSVPLWMLTLSRLWCHSPGLIPILSFFTPTPAFFVTRFIAPLRFQNRFSYSSRESESFISII